ncbi:MAG: CmcJ/NvfI family oxidoreductase, partial [Gammaproteobacteria bacterium]
NVWRPLRGPVQDVPLGICDAASIAPDDFIATDLRYADRTGEIYSVRYSARHRWFFLGDMQADEVMLLKCFDSAGDGRARYTAHSGFRDPAAGDDVLPRRSIEVRTIAFF